MLLVCCVREIGLIRHTQTCAFCCTGAGSIQSKAASKNAAKRRNRKGKAGAGGGAEGEADGEPDGDGVSAVESGAEDWCTVMSLSVIDGVPGLRLDSCALGQLAL